MHAVSQAIKTIIDNTPGYSLDILLADLGAKQGPEFLTSQEAAKKLKISISTIRRWERIGILHPLKAGQGKNNRYLLSEIMTVLKKGY